MIRFADFLDTISRAKGSDAIAREWGRVMHDDGFDDFMVGGWSRQSETGHYGPVTLTTYDDGWLDEYNAHHFKVDPILRRAFENPVPFVWSDVEITTDAEREFMKHAQDAIGLNGISATLPGPPGELGAMSVCSRHGDVDASEKLERVFAFSSAAHMQMLIVERRKAVEAIHLTPKQREVLQWLATRYQPEEIAARMGVGTATVMSHVRAIYDEFGVGKRTAAVMIGISTGLIDIPDK